MNNKQLALPAHPYNARLGSGILLDGRSADVYQGGRPVATGTLQAPLSPWSFWYRLKFVSLFPQVGHWWFYSGWTQLVRVRLGRRDGTEMGGLMQFVSAENPAQAWFYEQGALSLPYPPGEENSGNFPLRLALAGLAYGAAGNRIAEDHWYVATSLVAAGELERLLPTCWRQEWWLEGMADLNDVRASWCAALGIRPG